MTPNRKKQHLRCTKCKSSEYLIRTSDQYDEYWYCNNCGNDNVEEYNETGN